MKTKLFIAVVVAIMVMGIGKYKMIQQANAATTTQTLTFQWTQNEFVKESGNLNLLKDWRIYWKNKGAASFDSTPVAIVPYDPASGSTTFTSPATADVVGDPATTVTKTFVVVACGDVPQQDGANKYLCSNNSNEIDHSFWIPAGQFSVPVQFQIKTSQ